MDRTALALTEAAEGAEWDGLLHPGRCRGKKRQQQHEAYRRIHDALTYPAPTRPTRTCYWTDRSSRRRTRRPAVFDTQRGL
jgi:hypothetical protein